MTFPRRAAAIGAAIALVAFGLTWALPNIAGRTFVAVRIVATPVTDGPSPERIVVVGASEAMLASGLRLAIRVEGTYPLPVVVTSAQPPLRVELRALLAGGATQVVWRLAGSAAELETGADSDDGSGDGAILVRPGHIDLAIGPPDGQAFEDDAGGGLADGRYVLQAWAFEIASGPLAVTLLD